MCKLHIMQEQFISYLKKKMPEHDSLTDSVATILDINYDAAYRRVTGKTSLSLDEAVQLAKHYKISLNKLFEVGEQNTILASRSPQLKDEQDLEYYFKASKENLLPIARLKSATITYSAKDIPLFYTLKDSYLTRYKIYVWLKLINKDMAKKKTSFDDFIQTIPNSLLQSAYSLGETYNYINIVEFWNDNTINGTLQQIMYFFESGLLSKEFALRICDDLIAVIDHVEKQTIQQSIIGSKNKSTYNLYKSDLLTMSNTIMVTTSHQKVFFTPFTVLSYFKIEHQDTCDLMEDFFKRQKMNSKLLVNAGEKDRTLFFYKMYEKVDIIKERINIDKKLTFI